MLEQVTYQDILQRMLDRVTSQVDKREGSIIYDALAPAAFELMLMYFELGYIMNDAFADTASREFLMRRAAERGITPDPATHAILRGEFTPNHLDMKGQRFSMPNATISYTVKEQIASGVYTVECETAGIVGNQYLGNIIPILHVQGLETAALTELLIPAQDEQDTESLRREYLDSFDEQAFGGNRRDYLNKTNAINGVGATKVTPIWNGGGTVKLTILNAQYDKATEVLIDMVQQEIDPTRDGHGVGLAPIGHVVTVDTAVEADIHITMNIVFENGFSWASVQGQATQQIQNYLLELRQQWANSEVLIVRLTQLETRLLSIQGILDINKTTINGVADNLTLGEFEIPMFGGITLDA